MATGTVDTRLLESIEDGCSRTPRSLALLSGAGAPECHGGAWPVVKRFIDIAVSAVMLLVLSPLFVLIGVFIRVDSSGPVFFACERVGYLSRPLRMWKFRKMRDHARGSLLTLSDDKRFTCFGAWLARHKVDELPQLWHVLRGEMSLIGPRPEAEEFVSFFEAKYDRILAVRPGILGLSQLAFAREGQVLDRRQPAAHYVSRILPQKVALDSLYVDRQGLVLDIRILFWSFVAVVLGREVAVHRESGRLSLRRR
jgi:lipopolysaccharide/colanic/teichoic acid biosynthesis glycosyltransferase